jgi:hypothetical protein
MLCDLYLCLGFFFQSYYVIFVFDFTYIDKRLLMFGNFTKKVVEVDMV